MNKSLDFIKKRIASGECNGMENNKYDSLIQSVSPVQFLAQNNIKYPKFTDNHFEWILKIEPENGHKLKAIKASMDYNPNAEFQYFTMSRGVTDGTLFYAEYMTNVIEKILQMGTYYAPTFPKELGEELTIHYTVGDFVIGSEISPEFAPKDRKFLTNRQTVFLPIKCEYM